jgi:hypothetical protein
MRCLATILLVLLLGGPASSAVDPRHIVNGSVIPDEGYADQPYLVKTADGAWLCALTTGRGVEGETGQHVIAVVSRDHGQTWSTPIDIEPAGGPEASWAVPFATPYGRVYVFYTYNRDNIRQVPGVASRAVAARVDTLGAFVFRYSDDNGRTWSPRHEVPMRNIAADLDNNFGGKTVFFWSVGKPLADRGLAWVPYAKVTRWGTPGTLVRSRGFFFRSDNLVSERDPARLHWTMVPEGDEGLTSPKGPISEETNATVLSDGSLYAVYRTIDGYLCGAYSRDKGRTWTPPAWAVYAPGGRPIKNPRAFSFVRRFSNGKYLLWYHNHGGEAAHMRENWDYYRDRNPGWVSGGVERNGAILWSEPEVLLYDDEPATRMSYPDWIEDSGKFYIAETQKTVARLHHVDRSLLEGLWSQFEPGRVSRAGLGSEVKAISAGQHVAMPALPDLSTRAGFAVEFWARLKELSPGQTFLDTRDASGKGIVLETSNRASVRLRFSDGAAQGEWESDPGTGPGTLKVNRWQHIVAIVDGGPKIVSFVVDGVFNDGGPVRQFGWGRFAPAIAQVNGEREATLARDLLGEMRGLRVYTRLLRTSEAVGNFHAGLP